MVRAKAGTVHAATSILNGDKKDRVELRKTALYRFLSVMAHGRCRSATVSHGKAEKWKNTAPKKAVFFPFWAAIAKGAIEPGGALGEFDDFFVGDQLVLYINDRAARIIRWDFSVRVHLSRRTFPVKLIALTQVEETPEKDAAEKER